LEDSFHEPTLAHVNLVTITVTDSRPTRAKIDRCGPASLLTFCPPHLGQVRLPEWIENYRKMVENYREMVENYREIVENYRNMVENYRKL